MNWTILQIKVKVGNTALSNDRTASISPAASTIGVLLKRPGMIVGRKKRFKTPPYTQPLAHADEAIGYGVPISKAGFAAGMGSGSIP